MFSLSENHDQRWSGGVEVWVMRNEKGKVKWSEYGETESNDEEWIKNNEEERERETKEMGTRESVAKKGGSRGESKKWFEIVTDRGLLCAQEK